MPDSNKIKFNKVIGFSSSLDTEPYEVSDSLWTRAEGIGFRKGVTTVLEGYTDELSPTSKPTYLANKIVDGLATWFYTANSPSNTTGELWSTTGATHTKVLPLSENSGTMSDLFTRIGEHENVEFSADEVNWYNVELSVFIQHRDADTLHELVDYLVTDGDYGVIPMDATVLPLFSLDDRPQIGFLNGLIYLNTTKANGLYVYTGSEWSISQKYINWTAMRSGSDVVNLTGMDTAFSVIRPYKNFLIGMNIVEGQGASTQPDYVGYTGENSEQTSLIRWSDVQPDPSSDPEWDIRTPATLAGQVYAAETSDDIVDGLQLSDSFIVYKNRSIYSLDFVGGTYVMNLSFLHDNYGLIAKDCVVNVENYHFCVGQDKIYINTGVEVQQIGDGFVDNLFYKTLRSGMEQRTFVSVDSKNSEVMIHFVSVDNTDADPSPDKAIIWNSATKAWSIKNIPNVTFSSYGVYSPQQPNNWDTATNVNITWDNLNKIWNSNTFDADALYVMSISYQDSKFMIQDPNGYRVQTVEGYDFVLEKTGIDLDEDRAVKYIDRIVPHVSGSGVINVSVGGSYRFNDAISWKSSAPFNLSSGYSVDRRVSGRLLSISFSGVAVNNMTLYGFTFEGYQAGLR